jgi:hypothetical protein
MRLAVVTNKDLTKIKDHRQLRIETVEALNQDHALKQQLLDLRAQLGTVSASFRGNNPMIVVIQEGKIAQAIYDAPAFMNKVGVVRERYKVDKNGKLTAVSAAEFRLLPPLYVDGPNIKRKDTGEVVRFKGFEIYSVIHDSSQTSMETTMEMMGLSRIWGANIARFQLGLNFVSGRKDTIRQIVEEAERLGMYAMFSPSSLTGPYNDIPFPNEEAIGRIQVLADLSRPYDNTVIGIWNEPPEVSGDELYRSVISTIEHIRSVNPDALIALPGLGWSRQFGYLKGRIPTDNSLIAQVNLGPWIGNEKVVTPEMFEQAKRWMEPVLGEMPIIIAEALIPVEELYQTPEEAKWQNWVYDWADKNAIGWTQFSLCTWGEKYGGCLLRNSTGNPAPGTRKFDFMQSGEIAYDNLQTHPPTQFDE